MLEAYRTPQYGKKGRNAGKLGWANHGIMCSYQYAFSGSITPEAGEKGGKSNQSEIVGKFGRPAGTESFSRLW